MQRLARFGIVTADKVIGASVGDIRLLAKRIGRDHPLALSLWDAGWYDGRLLACFLADPAQVTPGMMDRWAAGFDNWATCDTACFHLFDKAPPAFVKVREWAARNDEFVPRAAFALLASVALHDKKAGDAAFLDCLPLAGAAASDDRNFVKKGVSWALRSIGTRSPACHAATADLAARLAASADRTERWVGKDVLRDITRPLVRRKAGI